jgi:alkanesulfonate monooxygenase SsuD/methylene tetrahydromethanopterin reductase-like flavin-dependent oxidoreductase (luciferase family)
MIEGQEDVRWPQWLALARACEQHAVPALFRSDHYLNVDRHPQRGSLDAWATICALAATTSTLRLGTMVSPASFRHPSVLAKLVTTADQVSNGRIELGIGAGWHPGEHQAYGFAFPAGPERMDVLEEQLQILVATWADEPFSFTGVHYKVRELDARPKPVQRPHPPIILGGNAGPRGAGLAVRFADEYNTPEPTLADVIKRRSRIERACHDAGRAPIPFSIMTGLVVGCDEPDLRARVRRVGDQIGADPGTLRREPPSGWIVGVISEVQAKLNALRDAGVSRVMCQHPLPDDLETVALLGDELAPLVA